MGCIPVQFKFCLLESQAAVSRARLQAFLVLVQGGLGFGLGLAVDFTPHQDPHILNAALDRKV